MPSGGYKLSPFADDPIANPLGCNSFGITHIWLDEKAKSESESKTNRCSKPYTLRLVVRLMRTFGCCIPSESYI